MSRWDQNMAQEAFDEASVMMAVELPDGTSLSALEGAPEAFEAGVWFGIASCISVLNRHGIVRLIKDGDSRE